MNKVNLSKSKYCKVVQCEKIIWLNRYKPECKVAKNNDSIFKTGKKVGELAKGYFGDYEDIEYDENLSAMIEKTAELLKDKPNVITEASFSYDNNFCSVDILKNDCDGVEIYEVKSSTDLEKHPIYQDDVAYQYYVLSNLGLNVKKAYILYINNEYEKDGELDLDKLFNSEDVTDTAIEKQTDIRNNINMINDFMEIHDRDNEPETDIEMHCFKPYHCDFWQYCTRNLPKPNVFDLNGLYMKNPTKIRKYHENKISFKDLEHEKINDKCLEQIDFELHDREPKIDKEKIKEFLSSLKYPLYFIDYESFNPAIPEYEKTKPYQQIPFQYSLHIIREEGAAPEHKEFLAQVDDENLIRHFAESLVDALPENGSVIVYNETFEKGNVNAKLAKMYSDLAPELKRINGNTIDMMKPFRDRIYYVKEMDGSASLKKVLPALYPNDSNLDYNKLKLVHDGFEASNAFLSLRDKSPEEQEPIRKELLEYCKLDSLAMVKIWQKFREATD